MSGFYKNGKGMVKKGKIQVGGSTYDEMLVDQVISIYDRLHVSVQASLPPFKHLFLQT